MLNKKEMITISLEEYEKLLDDRHMLDCLEACGVDNWEGYGDACEIKNAEDIEK